MIAVWAKINEESDVEGLQEARNKLESADGEVTLDFSSVRRVDAAMIRALEELADRANEREVKVALRGVNIDVYRVLKLVKLTSKFSFTS